MASLRAAAARARGIILYVRRRPQFSLRGALLGIAVACVLLSVAVSGRRYLSGIEDESRCRAHLLLIAMAMLDYQASFGVLPPAYVADERGKPMHSWRVLILPFMDQAMLYSRYHFDEPWNGSRNSLLASACPEIFHCPANAGTEQDLAKTNYFVVRGDNTLFPGAQAVRLADVSDPDDTIFIVEAIGTGIDWLEPDDLDIRALDFSSASAPGRNLSSYHIHGHNVAFANASPRVVKKILTKEDICTLLSARKGSDEKSAAFMRQIVRP